MASLPTVTSDIPRDLRQFLERVRETIGGRGEDEVVTVRRLVAAGLAAYTGGSLTPTDGTTSYGTPPAPLGLAASGALANIILTWDEPVYSGHAYTEVWAAEEPVGGGVPDLGEAVLVGMAPGSVFSHNIGGGATRWYWIKFVNLDGQAGAFNAVEGYQASTGENPTYLMEVLTKQYGVISEAPFFQLDANTVIDGVTIPAGTYMKTAFIVDGSISNAKIGDAAIDTAKISDAAITTAKISDAAITTAKIGTAQITNALVASAAIGTANIQNAAVDTAQIKDAAITNAKIANATINIAKINTASINALSSLSANIGTITAGRMQSSDGKFVIDLNNKLITITV